MVQKIEVQKQVEIRYQCEVCKKQHTLQPWAETCERECRCQHANIVYEFSDGWGEPASVEKTCSLCQKQFSYVTLTPRYGREFTQEQLAMLHDMFKD